MEENNTAEFEIEISATDATDEELDRMTRQLLAQLRELDVESVNLTKGGSAPKGSKGDPTTLGLITLQVLPTVLPSVIELAKAFMARGQGRTVKFKGRGIEFEGPPEELHKLLEKRGKKK